MIYKSMRHLWMQGMCFVSYIGYPSNMTASTTTRKGADKRLSRRWRRQGRKKSVALFIAWIQDQSESYHIPFPFFFVFYFVWLSLYNLACRKMHTRLWLIIHFLLFISLFLPMYKFSLVGHFFLGRGIFLCGSSIPHSLMSLCFTKYSPAISQVM